MGLNIMQLNNMMNGIDFRSILNTNFQTLRDAVETLQGIEKKSINYTDTFNESLVGDENSLQFVCNSNGIEILQYVDNEWQSICKYDASLSAYIVLEFTEAGIGYPIVNKDDSLEGLPVGYYNGSKVVAGTIKEDGSDPIHCVGWYKDGHLLKNGRIELSETLTAGTPVYVLNETGGWSIEVPVISGQLIQVIGFVSDDGKYIDFDIQPWCIVA